MNLMIGLDGYTISSGIFPAYLQGREIISVPLAEKGRMHIGYMLMIYRTVCNQISSDVYELLRMLSLEECHIRKLLSRTTAFRLRAP